MARSIQSIIEELSRKDSAPRMVNVRGSYRFEIEGVGTYRAEVDHGRFAFREDARPADCMIACSADDFVRFAGGEANLLTAYMQGRVKLEGDIALAKLLHGALPGPEPQPREGARA